MLGKHIRQWNHPLLLLLFHCCLVRHVGTKTKTVVVVVVVVVVVPLSYH